MIEEKDKIYERISGGIFILIIGWLLILITNGPIFFSKSIEQILLVLLFIISLLVYFLGKKNDNIPKIDTEIEIEYRHKKEN